MPVRWPEFFFFLGGAEDWAPLLAGWVPEAVAEPLALAPVAELLALAPVALEGEGS